MSRLDRLYELTHPGHPEAPSVQQMYADMLARFEAKCKRHLDELNGDGKRLMAYGITAMRRESE